MSARRLSSSALLLLVVVMCALGKFPTGTTADICTSPGCNCTITGQAWFILNCTLNGTQKLHIAPNAVPSKLMEIAIIGGEEVIFQSNAFNSFEAFHLVRVDAVQRFIIQKNAFFNLSSASILLQVQSCSRFIVESHAFKDTHAPVSVEATNCGSVYIQKTAFGRLQNGSFRNISQMNLAEEAFRFENQKILSHHGPASMLHFYNVKIPSILSRTFSSALAELKLHNAEIQEVHSEAFHAPQISSMIVNGCIVKKIRSGAFSSMTHIIDFKLLKTKIITIESNAFTNAFTNFTVEFSSITEIKTHAVSSTVAKAIITDNEFGTIYTEGLILKDADKVNMDNNIMRSIHESFMKLGPRLPFEFSFVHNEISKISSGALSFLPKLTDSSVRFDDNLFSEACRCDMKELIRDWSGNTTEDVSYIMDSSFCTVDDLLGKCFDIKGLINMANFTELVCKDYIKCEKYTGETVTTSNTTSLPMEDVGQSRKAFLIGALVLLGIIVLITSGFAVVVVAMRCWAISCLKRSKDYVQRLHYPQDLPCPEEGPSAPPAEPSIKSRDSIEIPTELTAEILEQLRAQLDNPETHDEASEIILRMCQEFAPEDLDREYDDAHLYEELSHLSNIRQAGKENHDNSELSGFLPSGGDERVGHTKPSAALAGDYSEPKDTTIHLYSELRQRPFEEEPLNNSTNTIKSNASGSRSNGSGTMAFRPLPARPIEDPYEAGPSRRN